MKLYILNIEFYSAMHQYSYKLIDYGDEMATKPSIYIDFKGVSIVLPGRYLVLI